MSVATPSTSGPFVRNMTALYRRDSRLAYRIDLLEHADSPTVEPSRAGPPTAFVRSAEGRPLHLHSRHDPVDEARRLIEPGAGEPALCAVLCGLGLGYYAAALFDALGPDGIVIVSEPDLATIRAALQVTDLSAPLEAGRLVLLHSLDKHELHEKLTPHATPMLLGTRMVVPPAARAIRADFHAAARQAIADFAAFSRMSIVTLVANGRITCDNIASNLPAYLATPAIDILAQRGAGVPAIVVSAGPSLSQNIAALRAAAGRAVIIAVQTSFKPLLAAGVRPDFVTTLDFSDLSRRFFDDVADFGETILVAEPKASPAVIDRFRGGAGAAARPVLILNNDFAHRCVGAPLAARAGLRPGSTVAHLSLYLAEYLGCDPIIFVGQDLAFSGGVYYTPGVAMHDAWRPELGRFCSLEQKEWERIVRHRPILRRVTGVDGEPLYTDEQMFTYLEQFERDFATARARIIDATQGGVQKRGATALPLAEAIAQFCQRPLPAAMGEIRAAARRYDVERVRAGRAELLSRQGELTAFRELCRQTDALLAELESRVDDPPRFNQLIIRVDELRARVSEHDRVFRMASDVSQMAELQKISADKRVIAGRLAGRDRSLAQLARDRRFVAALIEGCDALAGIFARAAARFDAELAEGAAT
ncbi:MAG: 6-hydroxymethylpterin diphosphokinase MptE-like protein [Phycisphaerae bacterium]